MGGRGTPLYEPVKVCAAPKGVDFAPFLSQNGSEYGFCRGHFDLELGIVFVVTTEVYECICREKEEHAYSTWIVRNVFV